MVTKQDFTRRDFLKATLIAGAAGAAGTTALAAAGKGKGKGKKKAAPSIVPESAKGANERIQVAQIGAGRIARSSELPGVLRHHQLARFVAVCDLDTVRIQDGKDMIAEAYKRYKVAQPEVKGCVDYHELLADKSIDAVCISTPDHWHAQPAIEAALAGKAIYLQKPASLTIVEGRQMADVVKKCGVVFQQGSQQRSDEFFRKATELVRNGVIGKVKEIIIGLPVDPSGGNPKEMPVPENLNYDMWLGETPLVPYTLDRVHPQTPTMKGRYDRPGWLRCEQFGAGMITGWGVHHFDIANWAMGWEETGPVEVEAKAKFPEPGSGLWDVHGPYQITMKYADGTIVRVSDEYDNGLKFIGENGQWIWTCRGGRAATASDPVSKGGSKAALDASDRKLLDYKFKDSDVRVHVSPKDDHHLDWLTAIKTKGATVAPAEVGHRACSVSLVCHASMKLGRKVTWDPKAEKFGDEEANKMLTRPQRAPYGPDAVLKKAGIQI